MLNNPLGKILGLVAAILPVMSVAAVDLPPTVKVPLGKVEPICNFPYPEWRKAQVVEGVEIQESLRCIPDDPNTVAAFVKGTNNISMTTLMDTYLATDSVIKQNDTDGDGDPDHILIKLEVTELNGHSPDFQGYVPTFDIAPGIQPGLWVFSPKTRGMATKDFVSIEANPLLRAPSPVIRVEEGDVVWIQLENTHYFPHTIHLHGVDHPYVDSSGEGNDGVPQTSDTFVLPGETRTYEIKPRHAGTMVYHCHVQTHMHIGMGLIGMFIVEENRPNNWLQTLNVGAGHVRHPSKAVMEDYDQEYDMQYHGIDIELHRTIQDYNDPRLIARKQNQEHDMTEATEDYHTLNGLSFPYTLRESIITVEPNQNIKIRMFNSQSELAAIHTHGHKATITHYDGVEHNPAAQITRDIYDMAPAQRVDLKLSTVDDGLHSYGEGIWVFHDHVETGITTNGQNLGGGVSAVVYKSYLNEDGMPKTQGINLAPFFTKEFHARQYPVWQDIDEWNSLGDVEVVAGESGGEIDMTPQFMQQAQSPTSGAKPSNNSFRNFIIGLVLGILTFLLIMNRDKLSSLVKKAASDKGGKKVRGGKKNA
ncbi:MAG: multicopper oxidase domain-containing protein [Gammaproteobacteria bacterium]